MPKGHLPFALLSLSLFLTPPLIVFRSFALASHQFLAEGCSNLLLFIASFTTGDNQTGLQMAAFNVGLLAVFVPIFQLVEQRILTPSIGVVQKKGCDPKVLIGALVVLIASMPGAIVKAIAAFGGGGGGGGGGADVGGAFATCCGKLAVLFGRSAASGDFAAAKATPVKTSAADKKVSFEKDKAIAKV